MRIAVCGTKGGSGKSTLAGLLALCLADANKYVETLDRDPQATLSTWLRGLGGKDPSLTPTPNEKEPYGRTNIGNYSNASATSPKIVIADFPPASPDALLRMLNEKSGFAWDVLLVPCRPALADIWSIRSFLEKLDGYKGKVRLVMNALDNSSISKAGSLQTLLKGIKTPLTKATLSRRACYSYAMAGGWPALDEKAKSEVLSLALELSR
jgi:cellulose biosynthesis protein BcsQ